jgi:peroxiredoxin
MDSRKENGSPMKRWCALLALATTCAGCGESLASSGPPASATSSDDARVLDVTAEMGAPHVGDSAPDFDLVDQTGAHIKLSSLRGSVVVLAFVTSWCPFSKAEQPYLKAMAEDYAGRNVKFVAVDVNEAEKGYREYLARVPMPFPVVSDADAKTTLSFTPPGAQPAFTDRTRAIVTSSLVLDSTGTIRFFGLLDTAHFDAKLLHARKAVDSLLAEAPPK